MSNSWTLITTIHDPDRRMVDFIEASVERLAMYADVFASVTDQTSGATVSRLCRAIKNVEIVPTGAPGSAQRRALRSAAEAGHQSFFYCDFDRWLHWNARFPEELADLPRRISSDHSQAWYVCLGRTERAFSTHPAAQRLPEEATNRALTAVLGRRVDATAGAAWIGIEASRHILEGSVANSKATDLEWPGLVTRAGGQVDGVFLDGLEFETADFYSDECMRLGSIEAWIQQTYDRPEVLQQRLQLAVDSIAAMRSALAGDTRAPERESTQTRLEIV